MAFGCDQTMWRFLAPAFEDRFRTVTFDLVGSGGSDLSAYDRARYASLHGYADDLLEILDEFAKRPGGLRRPFGQHHDRPCWPRSRRRERFAAQVMVGPSPCYINDGDYVGGFSREDIDELLETMDANYLGWSSSMAPMIMGAPNQPSCARN
jgi:sigma-B regulation protein RsbQ